MKTLAVILAVATTFCSLVGCGASRPSKYYQLTVPSDPPASADSPTFPVTLLVAPLKASHLYREDRIVYSSGSEEMGTYEYQRWAEPPAEMIEASLLRELRASGRYRSVYHSASNTTGDFVLHGRLYDFKEVSSSGIVARLTLELELRDTKAGSTVWTHYYTHDEPVSGKNVSAVVAALDRNVQRAVSETSAGLNQYFAARVPK